MGFLYREAPPAYLGCGCSDHLRRSPVAPDDVPTTMIAGFGERFLSKIVDMGATFVLFKFRLCPPAAETYPDVGKGVFRGACVVQGGPGRPPQVLAGMHLPHRALPGLARLWAPPGQQHLQPANSCLASSTILQTAQEASLLVDKILTINHHHPNSAT